jgi:coenzyme F420-dependent glucose-6-phosphate dehydrogenase
LTRPRPGSSAPIAADSRTRHYYFAGHEQFAPRELLEHAVAAERAGFDGIGCSDHFAPWWPEGQSGQAWVWLGAAAQATQRVPLGTGVTAPVHRYHPAVVAQAFMTLQTMYPGRIFLGLGSGESLNETPAGMDWPSVGEQLERLEEALQIINALFAGEHVDHHGRHFRTNGAYLYTRADERPPVYVSAFGPKAAALAGRYADGLWTLSDPDTVPELIDAYRAACDDADRPAGEILLQTGVSWAESDEAAFAGAEPWRATQPDEYYVEDWHDPASMTEHARRTVSDDEFRENFIIGTDPAEHAERIREIERLGATIVCLMNISGADPLAAIEVYGEHVLPSLRSGTAVS